MKNESNEGKGGEVVIFILVYRKIKKWVLLRALLENGGFEN